MQIWHHPWGISGKLPRVIVLCASLRFNLSGPSFRRSARFVGTNHNSFSWPAKLLSRMGVANKNLPDVFVPSMNASSIPATLRFVIKLAGAL